MKFKPGDKVKFLNETGSGIVKSYSAPNLVLVETSDGFDIPYPERELIPWEPFPGGGEADIEPVSPAGQPAAAEMAVPDVMVPADSASLDAAAKAKEAVFLLFLPYNQRGLIFGELDVYGVNATAVPLHMAVYSESENGYKLLFDSALPAGHRSYIASVNRDDLHFWESLHVMLLPLLPKSSKLYGPLSLEMRIKGSRFFKESSYEYSHFVDGKALIAKVMDEKEWPVLKETESGAADHDEPETTESEDRQEEFEDLILDFMTGEDRAEVDMHIWKLEPDYESLSKKDIFDIQLRYFYRVLESAKIHGVRKLIVIHGVGTGRLKQEIGDILDERGISHHPASIRDYGVGAMEILL